ncbi:MAG TPA: 2-dehydropantoate 2-reductase [Thermoplasmata archaeon]|nr:2-dehydropantoate 2-reductase [Thermoplasmata archaeon]
MKILIIGAGAIGTWLAGLLSLKNRVWILGRKQSFVAINRDGVEINGEFISKPKALVDIRKLNEDPELVIFAVKAYDTKRASNVIASHICNSTSLLTLQNGLGNEESIGEKFGISKVIGGTTTYGITYEAPGRVIHRGYGLTLVGRMDGKITSKLKEVSSVLNRAGIKTKITTNIRREKWLKAIVNAAINPLTALNGCRNGDLLDGNSLENLLESTCIECKGVANAYGIELSRDPLELTKEIVRGTARNYSSMLQSIRAGKRTEIDFINGHFVRVGKELGVSTPINEELVVKIKGMEQRLKL